MTARALERSLRVTFTVRLGPENDSDRPGSFTGNLKFKFKMARLVMIIMAATAARRRVQLDSELEVEVRRRVRA